MSYKTESVICVQILEEAMYIFHHAKAFGKSMNTLIIVPAMGK